MLDKKIVLFTLLALLSIAFGGILGLLDIFGFIDNRHGLSIALFTFSLLTVYFITITVFIFDFIESGRIAMAFILSSLLFGVTFFFMNLNLMLSIFSALLFFTFLFYVYTSSKNKAANHIKFSPDEIFLPIVKNGTFYLLVIVSAIAFTQSKSLVNQNNLVKPELVKILAKPAVKVLNSQVNSQVQQQIKTIPKEVTTKTGIQEVVRLMLHATVKTMAQNSSGSIYGIKPQEIPVDDVSIGSDGSVDLAPMFDSMSSTIASKVNNAIQKYSLIAPFIVAVITFLILQPLMIPINLIEGILTLIIFKTLLALKVIKITEVQMPVQKVSL